MKLLLGLWGCALVSLGYGHFIAALEPVRHIVLLQVGIARGLLEVLMGLIYLARGVVDFGQVWLALVAGAVVAVAYTVWYPRRVLAGGDRGDWTNDAAPGQDGR
jgi:hypothetical protein